MNPQKIKARRLELGLTTDEFAFALNLPEEDILLIEAGQSDYYRTPAFREAFEILEERVFGLYVGV